MGGSRWPRGRTARAGTAAARAGKLDGLGLQAMAGELGRMHAASLTGAVTACVRPRGRDLGAARPWADG